MKQVNFVITRELLNEAFEDLMRKHAHAYERVGFFLGKTLINGLEFVEYISVNDEDYIEDTTVGARIGSRALRRVLQTALSNQLGVFHVHIHEHQGIPMFSYTDEKFVRDFIPSFRGVCPCVAHGALLFSLDNFNSVVWLPDGSVINGEDSLLKIKKESL
jgi:hypothetical protein